MARTEKEKARYEHGNSNLPIHYEGGNLRVYTNPSGELFVKDTKSGTKIRISPCSYARGGLQFTTDGQVEPIQVNNMIEWSITPH